MINGDVRHEGCHVANTRHDARNHGPTQGRAVQRSRLADDGTDSVCLDNAPDEERDTRNWHNDGLDGEQVAAEYTCKCFCMGLLYGTPVWDAHILWIGNHIAGREMSQKRKKHMKSRVVIPAEAGR